MNNKTVIIVVALLALLYFSNTGAQAVTGEELASNFSDGAMQLLNNAWTFIVSNPIWAILGILVIIGLWLSK